MIRYRFVALASFVLALAGSAAELRAQITPRIDARTPGRGPVEGGTTVEVISNGWFSSLSTPIVTMLPAGAQPTNVVRHSPTRLTFVTPARPAGLVTVTISSGSTTLPINFRYVTRTRLNVPGARRPVFSYDGQYMAFESRYALVPEDTNGVTDIYVRNRATGAVRRVSVSSTGAQALGESINAAISADGRFVAFQSPATNLVPGDTNDAIDVFVRDRDVDRDGIFDEPGAVSTERVSVASAGTTGPPPQGVNGDSLAPVISGDGRYVAFHSMATNLDPPRFDNNNRFDVYVHDRQTRQTRLVSTNAANDVLGNGHSRNAAMSLNGRFIAFESLAGNIAGGNSNQLGPLSDIFLRDRDTDEDGVMDEPEQVDTRLVSVNSCEVPMTNHAIEPSITFDGRYIVFSTAAGNAIVDQNCANADFNRVLDVFIYDRLLGSVMRRLSQGPNGAEFIGSSGAPKISGNGNLLLFTTQAQNSGTPTAPGLTIGAANDGKSTTGQVPSPTTPDPPPADVPPPPPTQDAEDPEVSGDGNTTGGTNEADTGTNDGEPVVEVEEPEPDVVGSPFIAGLAASSGPTTGGNVVEVQGGWFIQNQTTVQWNGVNLPAGVTFVNSNLLRVTVPPSAAGPVPVRVLAGPAGSVQASNEVQYSYVTGLSAPTITSVDPSTGFVTGGIPVQINGAGFSLAGSRVRFGPYEATVTSRLANRIIATLPNVAAAGPVPVVVENADGVTAVSGSPFLYTFPPIVAPPSVLAAGGVVPAAGPVAGGTAVTITGENFIAGATVTFNGVPATDVQVLGNTQILAVTPAGVEGSADVIVTTTNGASTARPFNYLPAAAPVLTCTGPDTDGDGATDAWETQYGFIPGDPLDGTLDTDGDGVTNAQECVAMTHPRGFYSRYLAEGATGSFFDTRVVLANPGVTPAHVLFRFQTGGGQVVRHYLVVPAQVRRTLDLRLLPGLESVTISTTMESDVQVVLDRTMRWDNQSRFGAHAETSSAAPSLVWYLAEGATHGSFDLFYLLQNPSQTQSAQVEIRYLLPSGSPIVQNRTIAPNTRATIYVDQQPGLDATDVSGVITSLNGVPIIAERAMYASAAGTFAAGHDSAGVTSPSLAWFFAEGSTGNFFDTFLLFANPNASDANVQATYLLPSGQTVVKPYTILANSRRTINVQFEDPALASTAVSAQIVSTNGVSFLAERSMWWPHGQAWTEAHNAAGATSTGTKWAVADGEAGTLPDDTATFLLLANTSAFAGTVRITLLFEIGAAASQEFTVAGNSRLSVPILTTDLPANPAYMRVPRGTRFSAVIESLGVTPAQIVVERAMYWNAQGQLWSAGSDLLATKLQ